MKSNNILISSSRLFHPYSLVLLGLDNSKPYVPYPHLNTHPWTLPIEEE